MTTPAPNSPEPLREEILADARRQSGELIARARQEAEATLAKAADDAEQARREQLEAARAEAARRRELILATVPVETGRRRSARIEELLRAIYDDARRRLLAREDSGHREILAALSAEGIGRMNGESFVIKLSPSDRKVHGAGLAEEVARRVGRSPLTITLSEDPTITDGGVILEDAEGRQVWDNRLSSRLDRLWPQLRPQIAVQAGLVSAPKPGGGV